MNFAQALTAALLHFVWQGLVVAIILWLGLRCLQRSSANTRYLTACAGLATLTALPVATTLLLWSHSVPAAVAREFAAVQSFAPQYETGAARIDLFAATQRWALFIWAAGVLILSTRLVWACRAVSRLRNSGEPASEDILESAARLHARFAIARPVRVVATILADSPSVVGWLRPVVLLPAASLLQLTPQQLESILAHEFAHIRRHDYLVNLMQTLVETLLFYHPAVWWTSARLRHERELCCDDDAVRACGDPACYARALLALERLRVTGPSPALALGSTGGSLLYRIQRLAGVRPVSGTPSRLPGMLAIALGVLGLLASLNGVRAQEVGGKPGWVSFATGRDRPGVTVDTRDAAILHRVPVEFPETARARGVHGAVVVEATLAANGTVDDARVVSGPAELRRVALQSVLQWHFVKDFAGSTRQVTILFDASKAEDPALDGGVPGTVGFSVARTLAGGDGAPVTTSVNVSPELALAPDAPAIAERAGNPELLGTLAPPAPELREYRNRFAFAGASGRLFEAAAVSAGEPVPPSLTGKVLHSIQVTGLPDTARRQLLSALPAHAGETITAALLDRITSVVRDFDEHLEISLGEDQTHQVRLHISAPNSGGTIELRSVQTDK